MELQSQVKELGAKGLGLATISYDPVETLAVFSKQHGVTFPMLSDVGSTTIKKPAGGTYDRCTHNGDA